MGDASQMAQGQPADGVQVLAYPAISPANDAVHPMARGFEQAIRRGEQVVVSLAEYKRRGMEPDVIVAHPGWGDAFFVRDFFPGARVVGMFEYFYHARGADVGFDPEFPAQFSDVFRLHASNATQLLALESCDDAVCPTAWQKSRFPVVYHHKLRVLHEGIDTKHVRPDPQARTTLPDGTVLRHGDEVLTFISRSLEPYRGFHVFMRALPAILQARPHCRVVIVGAQEGVSYGTAPGAGGHWKDVCLQELHAQGQAIDLQRVHFTGALPYADYLRVLQVSRAHVYLTYPFILSWSLLEAMAVGCTIIASSTAPVREAIANHVHGLLFPFKDHGTLARMTIGALADPAAHAPLGEAARQCAVERYDFDTVSLPAYRRLLGC
ncbi:glycosyltransferase [Acidovorax sp. LjRoot118]|uniref:glycosyltransferase n=1 Tax=Acidovorax sp. LjRoot118 TaxID=3342256 RepID=UPI003ECFB6DF